MSSPSLSFTRDYSKNLHPVGANTHSYLLIFGLLFGLVVGLCFYSAIIKLVKDEHRLITKYIRKIYYYVFVLFGILSLAMLFIHFIVCHSCYWLPVHLFVPAAGVCVVSCFLSSVCIHCQWCRTHVCIHSIGTNCEISLLIFSFPFAILGLNHFFLLLFLW